MVIWGMVCLLTLPHYSLCLKLSAVVHFVWHPIGEVRGITSCRSHTDEFDQKCSNVPQNSMVSHGSMVCPTIFPGFFMAHIGTSLDKPQSPGTGFEYRKFAELMAHEPGKTVGKLDIQRCTKSTAGLKHLNLHVLCSGLLWYINVYHIIISIVAEFLGMSHTQCPSGLMLLVNLWKKKTPLKNHRNSSSNRSWVMCLLKKSTAKCSIPISYIHWYDHGLSWIFYGHCWIPSGKLT